MRCITVHIVMFGKKALGYWFSSNIIEWTLYFADTKRDDTFIENIAKLLLFAMDR